MKIRKSIAIIPLALLVGFAAYNQTNDTEPQKTEPKIVFQDNFNGSTLDKSKWTNCYPGRNCDHDENKELQCYNSRNVKLNDGKLSLIAKRQTTTCSNGKNYKYTSGLIQTDDKFSFKYGYMEVRAKTTKDIGFWPTAWLLADDNTWPPELDPLEQVGGVPTSNFVSVHWDDNGYKYKQVEIKAGVDLTKGFHKYGMNWQKDKVEYFLDGKLVSTFKKNVPNKPMYILLNLAVGGTATPPPTKDTVFPSSFKVDYVKVWQ